MMPTSLTSIAFCALSLRAVLAANVTSPTPTSLSYAAPSGYSSKVYNASAATTTLSYSYSDEELAMLWNQVGKIQIGPITTTVQPTPEPSAYPRPGSMHPMVSFDMLVSENSLM